MNKKYNWLKNAALYCFPLLLGSSVPHLKAGTATPHLEVIQVRSRALSHNPLHDPALRSVAIFVPSSFTNGMSVPIIYYLPGYGSSSEDFIKNPKKWLALIQKVSSRITPMLLAVVDGRTKWGGSQYLNSPAQGNYADYVCEDIVQAVERRYLPPANGMRRIIAGHSSGGFGALRLGMSHQELFDGVIALSPDSDFPVSHLPLVRRPDVTNVPLAEIRLIASGKTPVPRNGDLLYMLGLSAAYAPRGRSYPGQFEWLYDAQGRFRKDVWQRWLQNDPLTIVQENPHAFLASQKIYLDGAAHDEYFANIGAKCIYEIIHRGPAKSTFYEPPGRHGDHLPERLERGLAWLFGQPLHPIK